MWKFQYQLAIKLQGRDIVNISTAAPEIAGTNQKKFEFDQIPTFSALFLWKK